MKPKAYKKSVVLGGGLNLFPLENPAEVAATLHLWQERIEREAFERGKKAVQDAIKMAIGL